MTETTLRGAEGTPRRGGVKGQRAALPSDVDINEGIAPHYEAHVTLSFSIKNLSGGGLNNMCQDVLYGKTVIKSLTTHHKMDKDDLFTV